MNQKMNRAGSSLNAKLDALQKSIINIKNAISNKGIDTSNLTKLSDFSNFINKIENLTAEMKSTIDKLNQYTSTENTYAKKLTKISTQLLSLAKEVQTLSEYEASGSMETPMTYMQKSIAGLEMGIKEIDGKLKTLFQNDPDKGYLKATSLQDISALLSKMPTDPFNSSITSKNFEDVEVINMRTGLKMWGFHPRKGTLISCESSPGSGSVVGYKLDGLQRNSVFGLSGDWSNCSITNMWGQIEIDYFTYRSGANNYQNMLIPQSKSINIQTSYNGTGTRRIYGLCQTPITLIIDGQ